MGIVQQKKWNRKTKLPVLDAEYGVGHGMKSVSWTDHWGHHIFVHTEVN